MFPGNSNISISQSTCTHFKSCVDGNSDFSTQIHGEYVFGRNAGSNWPLRGGKATVWEGGVKGVGFVYAANNLIKKKTRVCTALIDATDWAPTLYHLGGGNAELISAMTDGMNVWDTISQDAPSPRDEILHNIDPR